MAAEGVAQWNRAASQRLLMVPSVTPTMAAASAWVCPWYQSRSNGSRSASFMRRDGGMEFGPGRQPARVVGRLGRLRGHRPAVGGGVASSRSRGVVRPESPRALVVPGQINQLAAHLSRGRAEEVAGRGRGDRPQGPVEADEGVLSHVVSLLSAGKAGIALEHLAGQPGQSVRGAVQQRRAGRFVADAETVDAALDDGGVVLDGHGPVPSLAPASATPPEHARDPDYSPLRGGSHAWREDFFGVGFCLGPGLSLNLVSAVE